MLQMEEKMLEELKKGFRFFAHLSKDLDQASKLLQENDSQFTRRIYLRSLFAFIEGNSFHLRQMALAAHNHRTQCFSNEEIVMLEEKDIGIKDNGVLKVRKKHIDFATNIRFSQNSYIKAIGGDQPDYTSNGWAQLKKALKLRNRITHPRSEEDLNISDDELNVIHEAKEWYSSNVQFIF